MKLQVTSIEPAIDKKTQYVNVHFATTLTIEEFTTLSKLLNRWGIDVDVKQ